MTLMRSIKLDVKSATPGGATHASLVIDGQDTGALYLAEQEYELLVDTLRAGALESVDTLFEYDVPDDEEIDIDVFDE